MRRSGSAESSSLLLFVSNTNLILGFGGAAAMNFMEPIMNVVSLREERIQIDCVSYSTRQV
jgi:hypothetical protein